MYVINKKYLPTLLACSILLFHLMLESIYLIRSKNLNWILQILSSTNQSMIKIFVLYLSVSWCLPWFALVFTPYGLLDSSLKSVTTFLRIIRTYGKSWHTKVFYYYYLKNKVEKAFLIQIFPSLWYDFKGVLIVLNPGRFLNLK